MVSWSFNSDKLPEIGTDSWRHLQSNNRVSRTRECRPDMAWGAGLLEACCGMTRSWDLMVDAELLGQSGSRHGALHL